MEDVTRLVMKKRPLRKTYRVATLIKISKIKFLIWTSETQVDSPKKEFQGRIFDLVFRLLYFGRHLWSYKIIRLYSNLYYDNCFMRYIRMFLTRRAVKIWFWLCFTSRTLILEEIAYIKNMPKKDKKLLQKIYIHQPICFNN